MMNEKKIKAIQKGADPLCVMTREIRETEDPDEAWALCATGKWVVLLSVPSGSKVRYALGRVKD